MKHADVFAEMIKNTGLRFTGEVFRQLMLSEEFSTPGLMDSFIEACTSTDESGVENQVLAPEGDDDFCVRSELLDHEPPRGDVILKHLRDLIGCGYEGEHQVFCFDDDLTVYELAIVTRIRFTIFEELSNEPMFCIEDVELVSEDEGTLSHTGQLNAIKITSDFASAQVLFIDRTTH